MFYSFYSSMDLDCFTIPSEYLGGYIQTKVGCDKYVTKKVLESTSTVTELSMVVSQHDLHLAFMGLTKSLQHQWTFFFLATSYP